MKQKTFQRAFMQAYFIKSNKLSTNTKQYLVLVK